MHILGRSLQAYGPLAKTLNCFQSSVRNYLSARVMSVKAKTVNSPHLKRGDPLPPYTGTLRVYNMRYCPFAERTILVLNAKTVDYEVVNINLSDKPEWLTSVSPFGKVPAIEIAQGETVYESLVTAEYLDDVYPQRKLQSDDPLTRAKDKIVIEHANALYAVLIKSMRQDEALDEELFGRYCAAIEHIQSELSKRGTKFLGGEKPGYVDYMIWPWFERLPLVDNQRWNFWPLPEKYSRLTAYVADMIKDPAVSQYLVPEDILRKYSKGYRDRAPRYDFLDGQELSL